MTMYRRLLDLFRPTGHRLYIVGGHVRDRLLGIPPGDMDLSTDAVPDVVRRLLEETGFSVLDMGVEFGTLTARDRDTGEMIEITTLRTGERYHPGSRHPKVTFGRDLEDDLRRRDFTVNAMALDEEGRLVDPLGGMKDLNARILRTPGEPGVSFREDPLRILRGFRFMASLGFTLEEETFRAAGEHAPGLAFVAGERKQKEMNLLLSAPGERLPAALEAMLEAGVLLELLPELSGLASLRGGLHQPDPWEHTLAVMSRVPPDPLLRWAALFHDAGKGSATAAGSDREPHFQGHEKTGAGLAESAAESMRFSRAWRRSLVFLVMNHMRPALYRSGWSDGAVRRMAASAGENLERLLALAEGNIRSKAPATVPEGLMLLEELRKRLEGLERRKRLLARGTGRALQEALGLSGGRLSEAVARLEDGILEGNLPPEPGLEECIRFLESSGE